MCMISPSTTSLFTRCRAAAPPIPTFPHKGGRGLSSDSSAQFILVGIAVLHTLQLFCGGLHSNEETSYWASANVRFRARSLPVVFKVELATLALLRDRPYISALVKDVGNKALMFLIATDVDRKFRRQVTHGSRLTFSRSTDGIPSSPSRNTCAQPWRSFAGGLPIMVHPLAKA